MGVLREMILPTWRSRHRLWRRRLPEGGTANSAGRISTARSFLAVLVAALAAVFLAAVLELVWQDRIGIPKRIAAEQSDRALAILQRWRSLRDPDRSTSADSTSSPAEALVLDAPVLDPDLRALALIDAQGRILASIPPEWRGREAAQTIPEYEALAARDGAGGTHGSIERESARIEGGVLQFLGAAEVPERGRRSAPETLQGASEQLYLELDLDRLARSGWSARLKPSGWMPSLLASTGALVLGALLAQVGLGRFLSRSIAPVPRAAGQDGPESSGTTPKNGSTRLARGPRRLQASLDRFVRHLHTPTSSDDERSRLTYALEETSEGLWDWNLSTDLVYYSPRWKALLGYTGDEVGDRLEEWLSRVHPDDLASCRSAIERHRAGKTPDCSCEHRMRTKEGVWLWFVQRGRIVERTADGRALRMIGTHSNVNDRKLAERSLSYLVTLETVLAETSRSLLAAQPEAIERVVDRVLGALAFRLNADGASVFVLNQEGRELRMAHEWTSGESRLEGVQADTIDPERLPRWMETLRHGEDVRIQDLHTLPAAWEKDSSLLAQARMRSAAAAPLRTGERLVGFVSVHMESEARDWRESELRALRFFADMVGAALERHRYAVELMKSRQRLEEVALHDTLTGLPNRRLLAERMREAMAAAEESDTQLAVCYLDLDRFKPINDTYGHDIGDRILIAAAARLRAQIRESDTVARLGGDELVLLMGGFDSLIECVNFLDRLVKQLAQPYVVDGLELQVTASAGATLYPRDPNDADTLLRHADQAMYRAKQRGRNRCCFFDTMRDRRALVRRTQIERIGDALDRGELTLFYQPKVNMRSGQPIGAEALVRWQHPQQGLLLPRAFIPLIGKSDLQQRMDWWVLEHALEQIDAWHADGLDLNLSINVSAHSVQRDGFVDELAARLAQHGPLSPDSLSLEILESEALVDLETVAHVIRQCEDLGVRFALDDFGTGYSSLTYFRRLPAQVLKIDQTFVRDVLLSADDRNIVEGVIGLAHAFRREVIAEGVESAAHGLMLLEMGCERAQGFGVAEPMPPELLPSWIQGYSSPSLWSSRLLPEWSSEHMELLGLESIHRAWVARLARSALSGRATRPLELDLEQSELGRWLRGPGRRRYGHLEELSALEQRLESAHARARELVRALERQGASETEIDALLDARDRFVEALHRLQERVLTRGA